MRVLRALPKLILPALAVACGGLAACTTGQVKSTQSLAPTTAVQQAQEAQAADASGSQADGANSLAYEVENGAAPKTSRLRKPADKQARLQPSTLQAEPSAQTASLAEAGTAGANDTFDDATAAAPQLPLTAMLPEPRPVSPAAQGVQVASLDPGIGVSDERFGAADPQVPMAGAAGAQLAALSDKGDGAEAPTAPQGRVGPLSVAARSLELDQLIAHYANYYGVPEKLVRRVAKRESTFNPRASNGPYLGLMQISLPTARGMGYRGDRGGLLDAETNLKYAVRYLRGAFLVARGDHDKADRLYQTGYYYHAKRAGLLDETGVGRDRKRLRSPL